MPYESQRWSITLGHHLNKAGEGARVLTAMKKAGLRRPTLLGYRKNAKTAEIIIGVDEKTKGVAQAAKKAGPGSERKTEGVPGEGDISGRDGRDYLQLGAAGINIVSLHALAAGLGRCALLAVDPADMRKAAKVSHSEPRTAADRFERLNHVLIWRPAAGRAARIFDFPLSKTNVPKKLSRKNDISDFREIQG